MHFLPVLNAFLQDFTSHFLFHKLTVMTKISQPNGVLISSITWAVTLSWCENAYSRRLLSRRGGAILTHKIGHTDLVLRHNEASLAVLCMQDYKYLCSGYNF